MLTKDDYACTWDLCISIPSIFRFGTGTQIAVYGLLGIDRQIPPHDESLRVQLEALVKAFK